MVEEAFSTKRRSYVYGPVASWRLGRSLGIDPLNPPKTCTFDCVYCQLGKTAKKVSEPLSPRECPKVEEVAQELRKRLGKTLPKTLDYITVSGSGEPTLYPFLRELALAIKSVMPRVPLAILTNSSLLQRSDVRDALRSFDLVVAKLDAPKQELFELINQPFSDLKLDRVVEGLKELRKLIRRKLAIQVMLLKSSRDQRLNNAEIPIIKELSEVLSEVSPSVVYLNTPTRPPREPYIEPLKPSELIAAKEVLRNSLPEEVAIETYSPQTPAAAPHLKKPSEEEVLNLLRRRPCRLVDIALALQASIDEVNKVIDELLKKELVEATRHAGEVYFKAKP